MVLTTKRVAQLNKAGRYGDGHGLCLQVTPAGVKSWLLRFERNGRERWMGLGPLHTIDLKQARERARKAREQLLDGIDPLEAREAERARQALEAARTITFEQAAQLFCSDCRRGVGELLDHLRAHLCAFGVCCLRRSGHRGEGASGDTVKLWQAPIAPRVSV